MVGFIHSEKQILPLLLPTYHQTSDVWVWVKQWWDLDSHHCHLGSVSRLDHVTGYSSGMRIFSFLANFSFLIIIHVQNVADSVWSVQTGIFRRGVGVSAFCIDPWYWSPIKSQSVVSFRYFRFPPPFEPYHEKTCLQGVRPGRIQTGLLSHRSSLESWNLGYNNYRSYIICSANNKGADQTGRMCMLMCTFVIRIWHKKVHWTSKSVPFWTHLSV